MKPSEFLYGKIPENVIKIMKELDSRFIDREELKDKIKNYKMKKIRMELEEFKKEILELLK